MITFIAREGRIEKHKKRLRSLPLDMSDSMSIEEGFDLLMTFDDSTSAASTMTTTTETTRTTSTTAPTGRVTKELKKRQKKPYTHSAYVCDKCRKSHRKCTHPRANPASVSTTSAHGEKIQAKSMITDITTTALSRPSISRVFTNEVSQVPITFFIDNISNIFGFSTECKVQTEFWRGVVPQLSHSYPLLRDGISGLCYLFDDCPRPHNMTPADVLILISKTLSGLQAQLQQFETLRSADKAVSMIVTAFLAAATFFGLGSIEVLRSHIKGIHAILTSSWPDLTAASSPARTILLASRPQVFVCDQTPISLKHMYLIEPLLASMSSSELQDPEIVLGSLMHLVVLTNKAIIAREAAKDREKNTPATGVPELGAETSSVSSFRELCEYRIEQYVRLGQFREGNPRQPEELSMAIKEVFEYATLTFLKRSVGIAQHSPLSNLKADSAMLKSCIEAVRRIDSTVVLSWPEMVLQDIETWTTEMTRAVLNTNTKDMAIVPTYVLKSGGLKPWSNLDTFLSMPLQEVP